MNTDYLNKSLTMVEHEFYIGKDFDRKDKEKLIKLKTYGACIVADAMNGFNSMDNHIHSLVQGNTICGYAVTVRLRPGDNLLLHKAIDLAKGGDVLVIDTGGNYRNAVIGSIMSKIAFDKGIAGIIIDGAVRDVEELQQKKYPYFIVAVVPNTGDSDGPGMLNQPISCGNIPVLPGDIIVADDNGVVVVPQLYLDFVLKNCEKKIELELIRKKEIKKGNLISKKIMDKFQKQGISK